MEAGHFSDGCLRDADGSERQWPELAVLGDPVAHSLSPRLHAAALEARGIDARYEAIRVSRAELAAALESAQSAAVRGLNLTLPLKECALPLVRRCTDEVERIGAANTLALRRGIWTAHNTDARGLAMALERGLGGGLSRALRRCIVIGSGGSARAAVVALEGLGAGSVEVSARNPSRAAWASDLGVGVRALDHVDPAGSTLIVNCTPLGLDPDDPPPIAVNRLDRGTYVLDLTYGASPSALLRASSGNGQDGRAMLVAQAALAFSVWYGELPPLAEMAAAIGLQW
jgi:shikimate dehydrogenase